MAKISNNSTGTSLTTTSSRVGVRIAAPTLEERKKLEPPRQRGFSSIPNPDVLEKLIAQAVSALRRGVFWDRGSILNLLV